MKTKKKPCPSVSTDMDTLTLQQLKCNVNVNEKEKTDERCKADTEILLKKYNKEEKIGRNPAKDKKPI